MNELKLTTDINPDNMQQDSKLLIGTSSANKQDSNEFWPVWLLVL